MSAHSFSSLDATQFPLSQPCLCTFSMYIQDYLQTQMSTRPFLAKHMTSNTDILTGTFSGSFPMHSFLPVSSLYHFMERITEDKQPTWESKANKFSLEKDWIKSFFFFFIALGVELNIFQQEIVRAVNEKLYVCSLIYGFTLVKISCSLRWSHTYIPKFLNSPGELGKKQCKVLCSIASSHEFWAAEWLQTPAHDACRWL